MGCPNLPSKLTDPNSPRGCLLVAVDGEGTVQKSLDTSSESPSHPIKVSTITDPSLGSFCESVEAGHSSHSDASKIASLLGITRPSIQMDSQCKYGVLARGDSDIYLRIPVNATYEEKIWDHATGSLLIKEAGGTVTDVTGKPLDFSQGRTLSANKGVIATNGLIHDKVVAAVKQPRSSHAYSTHTPPSLSSLQVLRPFGEYRFLLRRNLNHDTDTLVTFLLAKFNDHPDPVFTQEKLRLLKTVAMWTRNRKVRYGVLMLSTGNKRFMDIDLGRDGFMNGLVESLENVRERARRRVLWIGSAVLGIVYLDWDHVSEWVQQKVEQQREAEYFDELPPTIYIKDVEEAEDEDKDEDDDEEEADDDEDLQHVAGHDLVRGTRLVESSDEENDDEDELVPIENFKELEEMMKIRPYAEVKAPKGDETRRFAAVNMNWDNIKTSTKSNGFKPTNGIIHAVHIYPSDFGQQRMEEEGYQGPPSEIFQPAAPKFKSKQIKKSKDSELSRPAKRPAPSPQRLQTPANGIIHGVHIYPSDFGKQRMEQEEYQGPPSEIFQPAAAPKSGKNKKTGSGKGKDSSELSRPVLHEEQESDFDQTRLRKYQLERLRYYYAVVECNSVATAKSIVDTCDGTELERTGNMFDLRYIPDNMEFESNQSHPPAWESKDDEDVAAGNASNSGPTTEEEGVEEGDADAAASGDNTHQQQQEEEMQQLLNERRLRRRRRLKAGTLFLEAYLRERKEKKKAKKIEGKKEKGQVNEKQHRVDDEGSDDEDTMGRVRPGTACSTTTSNSDMGDLGSPSASDSEPEPDMDSTKHPMPQSKAELELLMMNDGDLQLVGYPEEFH
ncbi:hypothetical protein HK102_002660 [Quaeritorhiza haematococci]|nr:hypothetical protein HK102_002660 [Quaeritorhiza haematococci]